MLSDYYLNIILFEVYATYQGMTRYFSYLLLISSTRVLLLVIVKDG